MKNYFLLFVFCLLITGSLSAQRIKAHQNNVWFFYLGNHSVSEKVKIHTDVFLRRADWSEDQQILIRPGIDYWIRPEISISTGYAFIRTYPYGAQPILHTADEHRWWEQIVLKHKIGKIGFNHRYRLEQRWLDTFTRDRGGEIRQVEDTYLNRVRYRLLFNLPLAGEPGTKNHLFIPVANEFFFNFGKNVRMNSYDQNRFQVGLGLQLSEPASVQLNYMNHHINKPDGIRQEVNHTLVLGFIYNIDFRKKEEKAD